MQFLSILIILPALINAEYTKLQWSDCGSKEVTLLDANVKPMPIVNPGTAYLNFLANFKRGTSGKLKADLNIVRTVSGVSLPIRW